MYSYVIVLPLFPPLHPYLYPLLSCSRSSIIYRHSYGSTTEDWKRWNVSAERNGCKDGVRELPLLLNEPVGRLARPPAPHASLFLLPPLHFFTAALCLFPRPEDPLESPLAGTRGST